MASATDDPDDAPEGVAFVREEDGTITAHDLETGLARGGDTRAEALARLADVLELHDGGGTEIEDTEEFLREELDVDPDELDGDRKLPDFMT